MAGLYIHIPFCRKACSYCDFHFSISLAQLDPMLEAIRREITLESDYLEGERLESIYFGGGTPSVVPAPEIRSFLGEIGGNYMVEKNAEITLEANPDDLNAEYLGELAVSGINRLSIGVQSFDDGDLNLMERRHDAERAVECIRNARESGFGNFNIDLIYGIPGMSTARWMKNLDTACRLRPPHIAAYHLTFEPGTMMDHRLRKGRIRAPGENESLDQFRLLTDRLEREGYEHYEISNFALPGMRSRHNSSYWEERKYLGVGPSAHSYNGESRRWNIAKNSSYIRGIKYGEPVREEEQLSRTDRFNEYLMTSLRTSRGLNLKYINDQWGPEYSEYAGRVSKPFLRSGILTGNKQVLRLTRDGMFIADHVIREMFMD